MTMRVLIGVDDTDVAGSPGTGRVARGLAAHLEALGLGVSQGVTRHQLLVDPGIPYTSHNSALCIGLESAADIEAIERACQEYLLARAVEGADPALCVAESQAVTPEVKRLGEWAKITVLAVKEATAAVARTSVALRSIAGGPEGVIGALAAVGLRAQGNDGRYVDLPGIRGVWGVISVQRLFEQTAVSAIVDTEGRPLAEGEQIDSQDWIRPNLIGGAPVMKVQRDPKRSERWVPDERRNRDSFPHR